MAVLRFPFSLFVDRTGRKICFQGTPVWRLVWFGDLNLLFRVPTRPPIQANTWWEAAGAQVHWLLSIGKVGRQILADEGWPELPFPPPPPQPNRDHFSRLLFPFLAISPTFRFPPAGGLDGCWDLNPWSLWVIGFSPSEGHKKSPIRLAPIRPIRPMAGRRRSRSWMR